MGAEEWLRVAVSVPTEAVEAVSYFLIELGSIGIAEGEWQPDTPAPARTLVQGFFPADRDGVALLASLRQHLRRSATVYPALVSCVPEAEVISSESWQEHWKTHFPPLPVGQRLLILPPWEVRPAQSQREVIEINPSMAFGTGHHATTHTCLEALEALCDTYGPPAQALDLGTGSGVLAIALAKLGAPSVWATDIDPTAREEARKNAGVNGVLTAVHISAASLNELPAPFQLVVANLFASTLIALGPAITRILTRPGHAILSGIQSDQAEAVLEAFRAPDWTLVEGRPKDDWTTLVLRRTED